MTRAIPFNGPRHTESARRSVSSGARFGDGIGAAAAGFGLWLIRESHYVNFTAAGGRRSPASRRGSDPLPISVGITGVAESRHRESGTGIIDCLAHRYGATRRAAAASYRN